MNGEEVFFSRLVVVYRYYTFRSADSCHQSVFLRVKEVKHSYAIYWPYTSTPWRKWLLIGMREGLLPSQRSVKKQ